MQTHCSNSYHCLSVTRARGISPQESRHAVSFLHTQRIACPSILSVNTLYSEPRLDRRHQVSEKERLLQQRDYIETNTPQQTMTDKNEANGQPKEEPVVRDFTEQEGIEHSLHRIDASLQAMSTVPAVPLSHYRVMPDAAKEAYEILQQGAVLIHGTSTKYTLLGKLDTVEQTNMSRDLQRGCELIATACLVLHEKSTGSSLSLRKHVIQASRGVVATTVNLIEAYTHGDALASQHDLGAQKTGAVWQMCSVILDKKVPMGNRNAMRRDLLTYTGECQETMDEFQELVDQGPARSTNNSVDDDGNDDGDDKVQSTQNSEPSDGTWEAFLAGQNEQYTTPKELAVAQAALSILKISRGTIKLTLQALDAVGDKLNESASTAEEKPPLAELQARLEWIRVLHEECCAIGEGVTDLGTTLYPPLKLSDVTNHLSRQIQSVERAIDHIMDASLTVLDEKEEEESSSRIITLDFHIDVSGMAGKLKTALTKRKQEVTDALAAVGYSLDTVE